MAATKLVELPAQAGITEIELLLPASLGTGEAGTIVILCKLAVLVILWQKTWVSL